MLEVATVEVAKVMRLPLECYRQKNKTNQVCLNSIILATLNFALCQLRVFFSVQNVCPSRLVIFTFYNNLFLTIIQY